MKILFEDNDVIVCIKPYGLISQADSAGADSAVKRLAEHSGCEIYPIHRLDKTTRGIMVFAKCRAAAATLSGDVAAGKMRKRYVALVYGEPCPDFGEMRDLLFFDRKRGKSFVVKRQRTGVKEAVLSYEKLSVGEKNGKTFSKVSIELGTGRTHQIRVQFSFRGYPLLGDRRYGAGDDEPQIALNAVGLEFNHPKTRECMKFEITEEFYEN